MKKIQKSTFNENDSFSSIQAVKPSVKPMVHMPKVCEPEKTLQEFYLTTYFSPTRA